MEERYLRTRNTVAEAMMPAQLDEAQQRAVDWQAAFDKRQSG